MLWFVAIVCALIWFLGLQTNHTLGGFLHVFIVIALVAAVVRVVRGRRAARPKPRRGSFEAYQRRK